MPSAKTNDNNWVWLLFILAQRLLAVMLYRLPGVVQHHNPAFWKFFVATFACVCGTCQFFRNNHVNSRQINWILSIGCTLMMLVLKHSARSSLWFRRWKLPYRWHCLNFFNKLNLLQHLLDLTAMLETTNIEGLSAIDVEISSEKILPAPG